MARCTWDDWLASIGPGERVERPSGTGEPSDDRCPTCGREAVSDSETAVAVLGLTLHAACARCGVCRRSLVGLEGGELVRVNRTLYCHVHNVEACAGCGEGACADGDDCERLFGRLWHAECALCWNCDRLLLLDADSQAVEADGHLLCSSCARHVFKTAKRTAHPDES